MCCLRALIIGADRVVQLAAVLPGGKELGVRIRLKSQFFCVYQPCNLGEATSSQNTYLENNNSYLILSCLDVKIKDNVCKIPGI